MRVEDIYERFGRLEAYRADSERRMDRMERSCHGCRGNVDERVGELDDRLRRLEVRVAWYAGAAAMLGTLGGNALRLLASWLGGG